MTDEDDRQRALMRSPAFEAELLAVREEGERVALFAQLRYIAAENGWKPGWAAHFYKSMYGSWPERAWEKVPPLRPTDNVRQQVARRKRSYQQSMRQYEEERRAESERSGGEETDVDGADATYAETERFGEPADCSDEGASAGGGHDIRG